MAFKSIRDPHTGAQVARYDPDTDRLELHPPSRGVRRVYELRPLREREPLPREVDSPRRLR